MADVEMRYSRTVVKDLFGVADIFAFRPDTDVVLLAQVTDNTHKAAHLTKCQGWVNTSGWVSERHLFDLMIYDKASELHTTRLRKGEPST